MREAWWDSIPAELRARPSSPGDKALHTRLFSGCGQEYEALDKSRQFCSEACKKKARSDAAAL